jgi:hypothetical protein
MKASAESAFEIIFSLVCSVGNDELIGNPSPWFNPMFQAFKMARNVVLGVHNVNEKIGTGWF